MTDQDRRNVDTVSVAIEDIDIDSLTVGEDDRLIRFDRLEQERSLLARLLYQAESSVVLYTDHFDTLLWGQPPVLTALTDALNRNSGFSMRTLAHSSDDLRQVGSPLVETLRQYMPRVECRLRKPIANDFNASCVIVDSVGYLYFPDPQRRSGTASFFGVATATKLLDVFDQAWQIAQPDPEMRVINI